MNVIKKIELKTKQDLYRLAVLKDFIVTCSSVDLDLKIFDRSLKTLENIFLIDDMLIAWIYKNFLKNEVILYSHDNACLIWVNIATHDYKVIPIDNIKHDFTSAYCWLENDYIIFVTYDVQYYGLDIKNGSLHIISNDIVKVKCPKLSDLIDLGCQKSLLPIRIKNGYIIEDHKDGSPLSIITIDYTRTVNPPSFLYHDVVYTHDIIIFIGEMCMQLVNASNDIFILYPEESYRFLIADIYLKDDKLELIILNGGYYDLRHNIISIYQLFK